MNKKILALFLLVAIVSVSAVSAFELGDLFNMGSSSGNVTVDGVNFTLPSGFKEVSNDSVENNLSSDIIDVNLSVSAKTFLNDKGDLIIISVSQSNVPVNETLAEYAAEGGNKTTINGIEGYSFSESGSEGFVFVKDGKEVYISATDKQMLNDIKIA